MKHWLIKQKGYFIGAAVGALGGFLYWKYIGCLDGTCAITSNPLHSTVYFGLAGLLAASFFKQDQSLEKKDNNIKQN